MKAACAWIKSKFKGCKNAHPKDKNIDECCDLMKESRRLLDAWHGILAGMLSDSEVFLSE